MKIEFEGNRMPVSAFYGPHPQFQFDDTNVARDHIKEEIYQKIGESGIWLITYSENSYTEDKKEQEIVRRQLALAEKNGLAMCVRDTRLLPDACPKKEELEQKRRAYGDYESFAGWTIMDEPGSDDYACEIAKTRHLKNFAPLSRKINTDTDFVAYLNLLPFFSHLGSKEGYQRYLEEYCTRFQPKMLSFDYYPFDGGGDVSNCHQYFINLALIRQAAKEHGIPFWTFIQAGKNWNDAKKMMEKTVNDRPTRAEFLWNVNIALAFGTKGIQYFPLIQPEWFAFEKGGGRDYERNGIFGADGKPTIWYQYVKAANRQIASVQEVLMHSKSKGLVMCGDLAKEVVGGSGVPVLESYEMLKSVTSDSSYGAVIGCFERENDIVLYVVNYDVEQSQMVTLNLHQEYDVNLMSADVSESRKVSMLPVRLGPGEAVLVLIESQNGNTCKSEEYCVNE